ncbi:MAG: PilX N-terminal domain-containing pilus assembly protein [Candidatus Competibacteraceae bacterium]
MKPNTFPQQQQGAALITALIILLIITVLGVAGLSDSTQQETMVGNAMFRQMAFQATETTLRDGEDTVENLPAERPTKGSATSETDFSATNYFMAQRTYNDPATLVNVLRTDAENDPNCNTTAVNISVKCLGDETGYSAFPNAADQWST